MVPDRFQAARPSIPASGSLVVLGGLSVFAPLIEGGTTHLPVLLIRLTLLVTCTVWVMASMKAGWITVYRTPLFPVVAGFVGWAAVSVLRSPYTAASLQWFISLCTYAVLFFLVVHLVDSVRQVRGLVAVLLSMGFFESALGLYQFIRVGTPRPTGTFFNANFFATYEMAVFMVAFGLLCYRRPPEGTRWETRLLWLAAGAVAAAFVLAQSRGALLAFVAAAAFIGLYRFGRAFLGVLALCLLVGALVPNPLAQRMLTVETKDPYAFTRLDIWKNSLQRIADHPWGAGLGLYKYTSFRYRFPVEEGVVRYGKRAESAHNEYLQMAVELGVAGLALFLGGVALFCREISETLKGPLLPEERGLVVGLSGGILGILVHGVVDSVFHEPALVLLLILLAGMIVVLKRLKMLGDSSVWAVPFPYHPARAALVGTVAVLFLFLILQPAAAWYAFDKGEGEARGGREEQALDWFEQATRIDPGTAAYRDAVALTAVRLYHQSGDPRWALKAVEELGIGLELNPLDGRFAHRLGTLYGLLADRTDAGANREKLLNQAATHYEQAIRLDPYSPFNYLELGKIRGAQGRPEEARAWFRQATSYEPNFLPARLHLAELALRDGQAQVAASEYAEIAKVRERYRGRVLNFLERQYLEVDDGPLKRALAGVPVP